MLPDVAEEAKAFAREGYRVFESVIDAETITRVRQRIDSLLGDLRRPPLFASASTPLPAAPNSAMVTPTGLALTRLLELAPELARDAVATPLGAGPGRLCQRLLGPATRVEGIGATVSDSSRPFFGWHTHTDGVEEGERIRSGIWRAPTRVERILTLLYLQELDDDHGALLVQPRAVGDPAGPSGRIQESEWPRRVVVRAPAGSMVLLDQSTWHAAHSTRRGGARMVIASCFARSDVKPAPWTDPSVAHFSDIIASSK